MSADIDDLARDGFVKLGGLLSEEEIKTLQRGCAEILSRPRIPFERYQAEHKHSPVYEPRVYENVDWTVGTDLIGTNADFDAIITKIVNHPRIKAVTEPVLGKGYKLWQVNIRRHEPGSQGQPLHQDHFGELGLSILVDDTPTVDGATVFWPGSHRWPMEYGDAGIPLLPKHLRPLLAAATGHPGDCAFFFNRTWHGRHPGPRQATAILMSFFAVGAKFSIHKTPENVLQKLDPELHRLLDPNTGLRPAEGNYVQVTGEPGASASDRSELQYALRSLTEPPLFTPWKVMRTWARARRAALDLVGRERLGRIRSAVQRVASGS